MELFLLLVVWFGLSFWVGTYADSRGRSMAGFFLLSVITSPLLGCIVVLLCKDLTAEEIKIKEQKREHELQLEAIKAIAGARSEPSSENILCRYCAEPIKAAAIKCRHCGSDLGPQPSTITP